MSASSGHELESLLENGDRLVVGAALGERRADHPVLGDRVVDLAVDAVEVRETRLDLEVARLDRDHLLVGPDGLFGAVVLRVVVRQDLVLAPRVLSQALLVVEVGELLVDLEPRRIDLVDLLVDRDGLQEEAVLARRSPRSA